MQCVLLMVAMLVSRERLDKLGSQVIILQTVTLLQPFSMTVATTLTIGGRVTEVLQLDHLPEVEVHPEAS